MRYVLRRIDEHMRDGMVPDYDRMTIEHFLPQNLAQHAVKPEEVGMIGNLLLVDGKLNDKLGNKRFSDKLEILSDSDLPLDDFLRNAETWDEAAIRERTKSLAELCYQKIFRV